MGFYPLLRMHIDLGLVYTRFQLSATNTAKATHMKVSESPTQSSPSS